MAVENYQLLAVPQCVDSSDINQWLQNINELAFAALQDTGAVSCTPIVGTTVAGECLALDRTTALALDPASGARNRIDKKIFLGPVHVSVDKVPLQFPGRDEFELPAQQRLITYAVIATCDGVPVATSQSMTVQDDSRSLIEMTMIAECAKDAVIEVCIDVLGTTLPPGVSVPEISTIFCGAVLCIAEPFTASLTEMDGFCCAPDVPDGCIIGREGIFLMQQNLESLYAYLSRGYLQSECSFSDTFADDQPHNIYSSTDDIQYLFVGSARICARNPSRVRSGEIIARMTVSCSNGSTITCPPVRQFFPGVEDDFPIGELICFSVPIVACGNCLAGGTITAGLNFTAQCGDTDVETTGEIVIDSIEQNMTLFTWRLIDPYAAGTLSIFEPQQIEKKIKRGVVQYLVDRAQEAFTYICDIQGIQSGCMRQSAQFTSQTTGGVLGTSIIRAAATLPTPPPNPIPVNKTTVLCTVQICLTNSSDYTPQLVTVDVKLVCPGQPDYVISFTCYVPAPLHGRPTLDDLNDLGNEIGSDTNCKTFPIQTTFPDCPINIPLSLEIESSATNLPVSITADFDCLTFNV